MPTSIHWLIYILAILLKDLRLTLASSMHYHPSSNELPLSKVTVYSKHHVDSSFSSALGSRILGLSVSIPLKSNCSLIADSYLVSKRLKAVPVLGSVRNNPHKERICEAERLRC